MRGLKIVILLFFCFTTFSYARQNGYLKVGSWVNVKDGSATNEKSLLPYIDILSVDDRTTGLMTRYRINYRYEKEDKNDFNTYTIDDIYFYLDKYDYEQRQSWFVYLGDVIRTYSPVSVWSRTMRGVEGGVIFNQDQGGFNNVKISGHAGLTRDRQKGLETADTNQTSYNGQFRQLSYGGEIGTFIGRFIKVEALYNIYQDDKKSLKASEDYLSTPLENNIFSAKLGYYANRTRTYLSYANSRYDDNTATGDNQELKGNALFLETENYRNLFHFVGRIYYIDENYFTEGVENFKNDLLKFFLGYDYRLSSLFTLLGSAYYQRNNTAFKPVQEILTDDEYQINLNGNLGIREDLSFGVRTKWGMSKSRKSINNDKTDWMLYEGGLDITKRYFLGSYFRNLRFTLTSTYYKTDDSSVIDGVQSGWQEILSTGLITGFDLIDWDNAFSIMFYRINNELSANENILSLSETFGYFLIPEFWKAFIKGSYQNSTADGSRQYYRYSAGIGSEYYFTVRHVIKFDTSFGEYITKTAGGNYKDYAVKVEYNYVI